MAEIGEYRRLIEQAGRLVLALSCRSTLKLGNARKLSDGSQGQHLPCYFDASEVAPPTLKIIDQRVTRH
jgi:hypothetical protein